jgi:D-3-phosphoglycerate dehydrogenase
MSQRGEPCKVVLVDTDGQKVPDWVRDSIEREGIELVVRDCATRADLATYAADADVVWLFGGSRVLQGGNLSAATRCRAILRTGSGTDNVPIEEATRRGIVVANTPAAISDAVSDHLIALLFAVTRRVAEFDRAIRQGRWGQPVVRGLRPVRGQTLGLVGFGHAAREVARKLGGFDMKVLAVDPFVPTEAVTAAGATAATLPELLAAADFVSLHCALTPQTRHLIGERELRQMKPSAVLLNTSRGPVVDQSALVRALREGWIAGAGLDVLEDEPPAADNPLFGLENVVLTPHVAGYSAVGTEARWKFSVEAVLAFARGEQPRSRVNR